VGPGGRILQELQDLDAVLAGIVEALDMGEISVDDVRRRLIKLRRRELRELRQLALRVSEAIG
jgi:hypothetical protein